MRLNALRMGRWRRPDDAPGGWGPPARRSRLAYLVLAGGAALFMLAVIFLMWPGVSDGTAPASSGVLSATEANRAVAADSMVAARDSDQVSRATGERATADQAAVQAPLISGECALRRAELAAESERIDRFDLDAVARLNVRIGLFNTECAVVTRDSGQPETAVTRDAPAGDTKGVASAAAKPSSDRQVANSKRRSADSTVKAAAVKRAQRSAAPSAAKPVADESVSSNGWNPTVLSVQSLLSKLGYQPGPSDGLMGKRTAQAVRKFQADNKLPVTGEVSLDLLESILATYPGSRAAGARQQPAPAGKAVARAAPVAGAKPKKSDTPVKAPAISPPVQAAGTGSRNEAAVKSTAPSAPARAPIAVAREMKLDSPTGASGIESLTAFERQTVEWVCASASTENGDQAYQQCIDSQIEAARRTGKPNLATLSPFERGAIVRLCADDRYGKGLSAYYACAQRHKISLATLQKKPNMNLLSSDVRASVRRNCDGLQFTESLPVYYRCVDTQIAAARR